MEKGFFVYAWDLAEEGPKSALAKIQELGANTVCVASSYHAGKLLVPGPSRKSTFLWMGRSILNRISNSTDAFSPSGIRSWISTISFGIGQNTTRICNSKPGPYALIIVRSDWSIRNFVSGLLLGIPTSTISARPMTKYSTMCGRCVRTWHRSRA